MVEAGHHDRSCEVGTRVVKKIIGAGDGNARGGDDPAGELLTGRARPGDRILDRNHAALRIDSLARSREPLPCGRNRLKAGPAGDLLGALGTGEAMSAIADDASASEVGPR
jgi:hypothetical protein